MLCPIALYQAIGTLVVKVAVLSEPTIYNFLSQAVLLKLERHELHDVWQTNRKIVIELYNYIYRTKSQELPSVII